MSALNSPDYEMTRFNGPKRKLLCYGATTPPKEARRLAPVKQADTTINADLK
jgi:hypothetical protein